MAHPAVLSFVTSVADGPLSQAGTVLLVLHREVGGVRHVNAPVAGPAVRAGMTHQALTAVLLGSLAVSLAPVAFV